MTTLLDNTSLPLWVYIILIVVGSILVLLTVAFLLRCWLVRRKARRGDFDILTGPTRRVTLRRGRMVPTSQHLSLTGSKFGMRQFGTLADNESTMTGRRSPFEWWNTIIDSRSQSRQDRMSQLETGSLTSRSASRATTILGRRDLLLSTPNLTPEKTKEPSTSTLELSIPSPLPSPTLSAQRTVNFSRFVPRAPGSPLTQRSQFTLSRISEKSPHNSMIGNPPTQPNRTSYFSTIHPLDHTPRAGRVPDSTPSPTTPRKSMTLTMSSTNVPSPKPSPALSQQHLNPPSSIPVAVRKPSQLSIEALSSPSYSPDADFEHVPMSTLSMPKPVAYRGTTSFPSKAAIYSHPNQSQINFSHRASTASRSSVSMLRKSSTSISPSGAVHDFQVPDFGSIPSELHDPLSTQSLEGNDGSDNDRQLRDVAGESKLGILTVPGKNNTKVLRKKSLKRTQVVSVVA